MSTQVIQRTSASLPAGLPLPAIRSNASARPDRFRALGSAMGLPVPAMPGEEAAYVLADRVRALADDVGVPKKLCELGLGASDIDRLAETALQDACLATNPRPTSKADLTAPFAAAL